MGFFTTREDVILSRFVNPHDRVLVVGPNIDIRLDPTLLVLVKKIKNRNVIVIDSQRGPKVYNGIEGQGDIDLFRQSIKKWIHRDPTQYLLSDARKMPFPDGTFHSIIDRATHLFVCTSSWSILIHQGYEVHQAILNAAEQLISEYDRVLKRHGKIIFLFSGKSLEYLKSISYSLKKRKYDLIEGEAKSPRALRIGARIYLLDREAVHNVVFFIVAVKK